MPTPSRPSRPPSGLAAAGPYIGIGIQIAATMIAFVLGGLWLDGRLGSSPWGLIGGVLLAFAGVGALLYRLARQTSRPEKDYDGDGRIGL